MRAGPSSSRLGACSTKAAAGAFSAPAAARKSARRRNRSIGTFRLPDGREITQELVMSAKRAATVVGWHAQGPSDDLSLRVRPLLACRDSHALHHANDAFDLDFAAGGPDIRWRPYDSLPPVLARSNGGYRHDPVWFRNFLPEEERARGVDPAQNPATPLAPPT